ncbi:MAG: aminoglycoside phosphotransferase family protein [Candidatus Binatia bacterium]
MSNQPRELEERIAEIVRRTWGADARPLAVRPLAGDASSRSYVRVRLAGGAPRSLVVMIQPDSGLPISSEELAVFDQPLREMPFLNVHRYLHAMNVAVPEVYAAEGELVLLEDLGDTSLWEAAQDCDEARRLELYRLAIDELVSLQLAGERRRDPDCIAFRQSFDARLFLWELDHFIEYGFAGRRLDDGDRVELRKRFEALAEDLASDPAVLTHRDYHSWNLFVRDGRIRVIDFQDALLAPVAYDLATLLNDRATPTLVTPPLERALITHFVRRRRERTGMEVSLDAFLPRYYRFVLQKSLKIVGRFHYLEQVKGRKGYVAMLPDTFSTLRRSFDNLPELGEIHALLARSFPELSS